MSYADNNIPQGIQKSSSHIQASPHVGPTVSKGLRQSKAGGANPFSKKVRGKSAPKRRRSR